MSINPSNTGLQGTTLKQTGSTKLVWITGASSGLGYELAKRYAENGHTVVASARRFEQLQLLCSEATREALTGKIIPLMLDVTDQVSVDAAIAKIKEDIGIPDTVILNAGYYQPCTLDEITVENFLATYGVNVSGTVRCMLGILPALRKRGNGHLVFVSSVAGYSGLPRAAAYGSSKAALTHLGESIKLECNAQGIDVTVVNPGFVKTPLTEKNSFPMPFIMEVETASKAMFKGIESRKFEVIFPKRFAWILKLLRILPYRLYFAITRRLL